jgi:D-amino-acid oxidase
MSGGLDAIVCGGFLQRCSLEDVVVIGCGVSGLSTAGLLREWGLSVRILTAAMPPETTSSVAAAIWYPYKAYPEDRVLAWGARTFEVFEELAGDPGTGVTMREGLELRREPAPDPWWADAVPDVRRCEGGELPPGYLDGHAFTVPVIEMPIYLRYLLDRFSAAGGTVEERTVSSLDEAAEGCRAVVDCAGLGARELAGDGEMLPIRGQIVRVRNPGLDRFLLDEENPDGVTYIVPRSEDCVLGGTADEGEWDTAPDPGVAEDILRRCARLEPRLAGARVLEHRAGLRPGRPEVRLETETLEDGTPCVHNYGHGGSGVTLSWGCAEEAAGLVRRALGAAG